MIDSYQCDVNVCCFFSNVFCRTARISCTAVSTTTNNHFPFLKILLLPSSLSSPTQDMAMLSMNWKSIPVTPLSCSQQAKVLLFLLGFFPSLYHSHLQTTPSGYGTWEQESALPYLEGSKVTETKYLVWWVSSEWVSECPQCRVCDRCVRVSN